MKQVEILLKIAFLALSVTFIIAQSIYSPLFNLLLIVCIVLGLVLLLNHHVGYKIKKGGKDLMYRHIEGGILILFAAVVSTLGF